MKIEFTVHAPGETRTYIREYEPSTPEYAIEDDAYMAAINYINSRNLETLDGVDTDWRRIKEV